VHSLITDYQRQFGFTAVLVTHEIPDIFYITQRIAMLDEGRIIFAGTPETLRHSPDPVIQAFIGGGTTAAEHGMAHPAELERCLGGEGADAAPGGAAPMLVFLTLDNLPELNSRFGYLAGQAAMKNLLAGVRGLLGPADTAARVGLDRIVVLLPGAGRQEAAAFSVRLGGLLARSELLAGAGAPGFCLEISAGYAEAVPGSRLEELLDVAAAGMQPLGTFDNCSAAEVP
jgi:phospholipid/cholesterol/gamma-HCH transport system ATP-binding protein